VEETFCVEETGKQVGDDWKQWLYEVRKEGERREEVGGRREGVCGGKFVTGFERVLKTAAKKCRRGKTKVLLSQLFGTK